MKYIILSSLFLIISCAPRVNYLGDSYTPTSHVDIYYDMGDIQDDFKVMGMLSANNHENTFLTLDKIKEKLVEEAKMKGADGLIFLNLISDNYDGENKHAIEAKLIKYR